MLENYDELPSGIQELLKPIVDVDFHYCEDSVNIGIDFHIDELGCVFDYGNVFDCNMTQQVSKKEDCPYWKKVPYDKLSAGEFVIFVVK